MKKQGFVVLRKKTKIVELIDEKRKEEFGEVEEITSRDVGATQANLAKVTLYGPDYLHSHKKAEETYICVDGIGEIYLNGQILDFTPGTRVIIRPGTLHAARPKEILRKLVFWCISSPPFNPKDDYYDPKGRDW